MFFKENYDIFFVSCLFQSHGHKITISFFLSFSPSLPPQSFFLLVTFKQYGNVVDI